jgi:hypothetical protein
MPVLWTYVCDISWLENVILWYAGTGRQSGAGGKYSSFLCVMTTLFSIEEGSRRSPVGIVSRLRAERHWNWGSIPWRGKYYFFIATSGLAIRLILTLNRWVPKVISLGLKREGALSYHWPSSDAKIKSAWSYTSAVLTTRCLLKHRGNFYLFHLNVVLGFSLLEFNVQLQISGISCVECFPVVQRALNLPFSGLVSPSVEGLMWIWQWEVKAPVSFTHRTPRYLYSGFRRPKTLNLKVATEILAETSKTLAFDVASSRKMKIYTLVFSWRHFDGLQQTWSVLELWGVMQHGVSVQRAMAWPTKNWRKDDQPARGHAVN